MSPSRKSVPPVVLAQSRAMSFAEAVTNVVVGYGIALATQLLLFPVLGLTIAITENVVIAAMFTLVSLVRSFVLRRLFERLRQRGHRNETAAQAGGGTTSMDGEVQSAIW
jgi:hypothetical protein